MTPAPGGRPAPGLTAAHVSELRAELEPLLVGGRVLDVQPEPPRDLLLVVEVGATDGGRTLRLRLSADRDAPRAHLQHGRLRRHAGSVGPFFEAAARELAGLEVRAIEQPREDRILLVSLAGEPPRRRRALVAELVGRHANLVLLDETERVLAVLVPPPERAKHAARLAVGAPWEPPPGRARGDGGSIERDLAAPAEGQPDQLAGLAPLSWRVEATLGAAARRARVERDRRALLDRVDRRLKKARGLEVGLAERARAASTAERVRRDGELLKAHLAEIGRGRGSIEVEDWYEPGAPARTIELDPKLAPHENLRRIFDRAKKLERSRDAVARERAIAAERVAALEALRERAEAEASDPAELEAEAVASGLLDPPQAPPSKRRAPPAPRLPYKSYRASSGAEIRVGRTARDNDVLTFRHARGNDLWLHTSDAPGSHVVLRVEKGAEPSDADVLDAAHLAVHFSPLRGARRADVHVARQKLLRKPKGAAPGLVTLAGGRTLAVRIEEERLARLLEARRRSGPASAGGDELRGEAR